MKTYHKIEFYVGLEFDADNKPIFFTPEHGRDTLLRFFPGLTYTKGFGSWEGSNGPVQELQVTFTVLLEEGSVSDPVYTARIAGEALRDVYKQSAVLTTLTTVVAAFV